MKSEERRQQIIKRLTEATAPVSAGILSQECGVSRQIIVKDIAQLRNEGFLISAFSRGYVLVRKNQFEKVFKVLHSDEDVARELNLIVDLGGAVEDVFVYHKCYNKVSARMDIRSRMDVQKFLDNIAAGKSSLLKNITSGYHYHTISAQNEETLTLIEEELWACGFLAKLQEYEPVEITTL